ncbi:MAG: nucleotide sugar dehydrogenase [Candidatus Neomarinimicrobiota bacterium]
MEQTLKNKIDDISAKIGVIGLGYVGLPLALEFAKKQFSVTGIDLNQARVEDLMAGKNYIPDVDNVSLARAVKTGSLRATTDFVVIKDLDVVLICVPTPLNKEKDPDVSHILDVMNELKKFVHEGMLICLESTTYPGTTRELVLPMLESSKLKVGTDFYLCFSPERVDPGNTYFTMTNTPKVVGGSTTTCTAIGAALYEHICEKVVKVSSTDTAETVKLLENTFRSINIGLVNETAIMCEKLGIDVWEVIEAAATKPFGFMKFTPGPGLGGHCIPIDPHYLAWKMKFFDYKAQFIELAGEINTRMPIHVVDLINDGLNAQRKSISMSKFVIIGVAYKKNIDDVRESPALDVMRILEDLGGSVDFYDPFVAEIDWSGDKKVGLESLTQKIVQSYDAAIIITDHDDLDYALIKNESKLIVDTRNVYADSRDSKIVHLGRGSKAARQTG